SDLYQERDRALSREGGDVQLNILLPPEAKELFKNLSNRLRVQHGELLGVLLAEFLQNRHAPVPDALARLADLSHLAIPLQSAPAQPTAPVQPLPAQPPKESANDRMARNLESAVEEIGQKADAAFSALSDPSVVEYEARMKALMARISAERR